ncbi:MAG: ribonuclease HII [Spirochaetota bacterium]|nr:ribonuclease HII [Spirochaetota bacterium]
MQLSVSHDIEIVQNILGTVTSESYFVGTDEAGRGPLAGPLVVAGVLFEKNIVIPNIFDSKKISEKKRDLLAPKIKELALAYHIEVISLSQIKELNIYQASKWGMIKCFLEIQKKINTQVLLTDAIKIKFSELPNINIIPLIKGDQKSFHIAAASILAKTERDKIMLELHKEFPMYHWNKNKGYPTKLHRLALQEFGVSPYHREGFKLK